MNRNGWPTASELLQELAAGTSDSRFPLLDQLRWLGVYALEHELESFVSRLRRSPQWDAALALEVSLSWVLAGQAHRADLAFLEADELAPSLALVPDVWGLWPAPAADRPAEINALVSLIRRWRHLDPIVLDASWRQRAQAEWTYALSSPGMEELVLLIRHEPALGSPIEPFLADLVGEELIASSPSQALQFWSLLIELRPEWIHARLKAADLALTCAEAERCAGWIATAPPEVRVNPWYWDIAARAALEAGAITAALDHWGQALAEAPPEMAEVFRQRRREARRGPGVLQARSLLERGETGAAVALLERLVADDPQWQPLQDLLHQAETVAAAGNAAVCVAARASQRFGQLLERTAARVGLSLPPAPPSPGEGSLDLDAVRKRLGAFSSFLSDAEARFALEA